MPHQRHALSASPPNKNAMSKPPSPPQQFMNRAGDDCISDRKYLKLPFCCTNAAASLAKYLRKNMSSISQLPIKTAIKSPNSGSLPPHTGVPRARSRSACAWNRVGPEAPAQPVTLAAYPHVNAAFLACVCSNASPGYTRLIGASLEVGEGLTPAGLQPTREKNEALLARRRPHKVKQHLKKPPLAGEGQSCY